MAVNGVDMEKGPIATRRLVALAFVMALAGGMAGCGSAEKRGDGSVVGGGADGGGVAGAADGGSIGGGADSVSIGTSDVYLACKLNGESVRIEGISTVVANYQVKEDETVVQTGGSQKYRFQFVVPGKTTGSFKLGDRYLSLMVMDMTTVAIWESSTDQDDKGATLQVDLTSYGSVGGYVEGTFSGTAVNILDGSKLVITEGQFRASRIADI